MRMPVTVWTSLAQSFMHVFEAFWDMALGTFNISEDRKEMFHALFIFSFFFISHFFIVHGWNENQSVERWLLAVFSFCTVNDHKYCHNHIPRKHMKRCRCFFANIYISFLSTVLRNITRYELLNLLWIVCNNAFSLYISLDFS